MSVEDFTVDSKNEVAVTSKINKRSKTISELRTVLFLVRYVLNIAISIL